MTKFYEVSDERARHFEYERHADETDEEFLARKFNEGAVQLGRHFTLIDQLFAVILGMLLYAAFTGVY